MKKILVLCDLEGVSGVVSFETDTSPDGINYRRSLRLAAGELNTLIRGLRRGGADEILLVDGHGYGGIDPELITEDADIYLGRPLFFPFELDKGWDGFVLFAHHAMAGTKGANLCHSWSHTTIYECKLNKKPIGEIGWYIYLAGYFKVPSILITGDDKACAEAKLYSPNINCAVVKKGISTNSAICKPPKFSQKIIEKMAEVAVRFIEKHKLPRLPSSPYNAEKVFLDPRYADIFCSQRPWAMRINNRTVSVSDNDFFNLTKKFL